MRLYQVTYVSTEEDGEQRVIVLAACAQSARRNVESLYSGATVRGVEVFKSEGRKAS